MPAVAPAPANTTRGELSRIVLSLVLGVLAFMACLVTSAISGIYWVFPGGCAALGLLLSVAAFWRARFAMGFAVAASTTPLVMELLDWLEIRGQNLTLLSIAVVIALYAVCFFRIIGTISDRRSGNRAAAEERSTAHHV